MIEEPKTMRVYSQKKTQMAARIPYDLHRKLYAYAQETGTTYTDVVISALNNYLGSTEDLSLESIESHDNPLDVIEAKLGRISGLCDQVIEKLDSPSL
jgi:predicted DNA-binding protein